ncbi:UNVERIFIED_CONTAM: hypothetical protein Scaly_0576300 [Sesamum calycinum]|uniref:Uncharacterized protein n=1 Tax=Sesamum calycinum TaxID=2727403 RepID=A0AAW2RRV0_9LAMI
MGYGTSINLMGRVSEEALQLLSSLDINGQNLQRRVIASSSDLSRTQAEESLSVANLRHKLHLYKVLFLLLTRNLKAAKREVKMAMNIAHAKDYPISLYLKSQLEYARGNHRKAIKLLMASSICTELLLGCVRPPELSAQQFSSWALSSLGPYCEKVPEGLPKAPCSIEPLGPNGLAYFGECACDCQCLTLIWDASLLPYPSSPHDLEREIFSSRSPAVIYLSPYFREWAFGDDPYEAPFGMREILERIRKMRVSHKEKRKMKSLGRQVTRDRGRLTLHSLKLANAYCLVEE